MTKFYRQSDFMEIRGLRINPVADRITRLFVAHGFVFNMQLPLKMPFKLIIIKSKDTSLSKVL